MKKLSWPYLGDKEMGSISPQGDPDRDIFEDNEPKDFSTPGYSAMVDHRSLGPDVEVPTTYSGGAFFPLQEEDDLIDIEEDGDLDVYSNTFINLLKVGSNLLGIGRQSDAGIKLLADRKYNIVSLENKKRSGSINLSGFHIEGASPMFYKSRYKIDGFFTSSSFGSPENTEISLKNIYSQLKPLSYGLIFSKDTFDIEPIIKKCNFKIIKKNKGKLSKFIVKKNDLPSAS